MFKKKSKKIENTKPVDPIDYTKYTTGELLDTVIPDGINITGREMQKARANDVDMFIKIAEEYLNNKKNREKAFAWYYQAALQDHDGAQYHVGDMYRCGLGVSQDYTQAMNSYLKAAENENTDAMNDVGWLYQKGQGVTANIPTAIEWYTKAANQGHSTAQANLGWIYQYKDEVKDLQLAVDWYQKAADNDFDCAADKVKELNDNGYFAEEEQKDEEKQETSDYDIDKNDIIHNTIQHDNHKQNTPTPLPNNADEVIEHTNDDEIKTLLNNLQLQMRNYEDSKGSLQNELFALQQNQIRQDEENRLLKQELAELKAQLHDISKTNHNASNVNPDHQNDINHDTEPNHNGFNERKSDQIQNTTHLPLTEVFVDPNYDSSDNEDPINDIYLD